METLSYNQRDENEQIWFVLSSKNHMKELQIRDEARNKGLEAFVPVMYAYQTVHGQKQRKLVPAINGYIFVKATPKELIDLIEKSHYILYPRKSTFTGKEDFLTVPNHEMENFIAVIEKAGEHITYFKPDEIALNPGDKIKIQGGFYDGREGIIMRIKGKRNKLLVVQIPGVIVAAVELKPEMVELQDTGASTGSATVKERPNVLREKPSKNPDKDRKLVFEIAHRLLFDYPEKHRQDEEYYLLLNELKRGVARIQSFKGYTPTTEAELALSLFLASKALDEDSEDSEKAQQRLQRAIPNLKDSSKLKSQCLQLLAKLNK